MKALIKSYGEDDPNRFFSVAMQMAAQAARSGHTTYSRDLRNLIDEAKSTKTGLVRSTGVTSQPRKILRDELIGLFSVDHPTTSLSEMVLGTEPSDQLEKIIREQLNRDRLESAGLEPIRKILLVGPPGTGKTMTAEAIAGQLQLPLFVIQLDSLITKFMGETAAKLRLVFDAMNATRGVYFFDEFDALGGNRAATNDVGEIRRVLNSFLQFIETDSSQSIVVAATNNPNLLDRALFRRFDTIINYELPSESDAVRLMKRYLKHHVPQEMDWESCGRASVGLSHSEISRASRQALKDAFLEGGLVVLGDRLSANLEERRRYLL